MPPPACRCPPGATSTACWIPQAAATKPSKTTPQGGKKWSLEQPAAPGSAAPLQRPAGRSPRKARGESWPRWPIASRHRAVVPLERRAARVRRRLDSQDGPDAREGRDTGYDVVQGIAVIPVTGTLVAKLGSMRPYSGMTGYDGIRASLSIAMSDPKVKAIAFDMESPGGEVAGCFDLVDAGSTAPAARSRCGRSSPRGTAYSRLLRHRRARAT